jgi:hypothetical protein
MGLNLNIDYNLKSDEKSTELTLMPGMGTPKHEYIRGEAAV